MVNDQNSVHKGWNSEGDGERVSKEWKNEEGEEGGGGVG